jgi:hypothetical protein
VEAREAAAAFLGGGPLGIPEGVRHVEAMFYSELGIRALLEPILILAVAVFIVAYHRNSQ